MKKVSKSKINGATKCAALRHIVRLRRINPKTIRDKALRYVAHRKASGKAFRHVTYPTAAKIFDISVRDLERLLTTTPILNTEVDKNGVRWLSTNHIYAFAYHLEHTP